MRQVIKKLLNKPHLSIFILVLLFCLGLVTRGIVLAWTEPTASPPDGNVSPPLNTSATDQFKEGHLLINGVDADMPPGAELEVKGNIIANLPTASNHMATKAYVDAAVLAAGGGGIAELSPTDAGRGGPLLEWIQMPNAGNNYQAKVRYGPNLTGTYSYDCYYRLGASGSWTYQADCGNASYINAITLVDGNTLYVITKSSGSVSVAYTVINTDTNCTSCKNSLAACKAGWTDEGMSCNNDLYINECQRLCTQSSGTYSNILTYTRGEATCGNSWLEGSEVCDDGNSIDTDYCLSTCNLNPNFGFIFVTDNTYTGKINYASSELGLQSADSACATAAQNANLRTTGLYYNAWMSAGAIYAKNLSIKFPLYNTRGQIVANNLNDLTDNNINNPIKYSATGQDKGAVGVWTSTKADGTVQLNTCRSWSSNAPGDSGELGSSSDTNNKWTADTSTNCSFSKNLYCLAVTSERSTYCGDGFLHQDLGEECDDGNLTNGDGCTSNCKIQGNVIYIVGYTTGLMGGRTGADSTCASAKPAGLSASCTTIKAFLNFSAADDIADMPTNYGYNSSAPIYWFNNTTRIYTRLANNWSNMCTSPNILASQQAGTGESADAWGGPYCNWAGDGGNNNCQTWDSNDPNSGYVFGPVGSGTRTDTWLYNGETYNACNVSRLLRCVCKVP